MCITLALAACATITADANQAITVITSPAGARCQLSNTHEHWVIGQTPNTAQVTRGFEPLSITCTLEGHAPAHTVVEAKTRGRAYGNILLGGFPAYVDAANGKGYEYEPDSITLTLQPVIAAN